MSIFIHAILCKADGLAIIKQIEAAKKAGIGRVGIFNGLYGSYSCDVSIAIRVVNTHISKLN